MSDEKRFFFAPRNRAEAIRLVCVYTAIAIAVAVTVTYFTSRADAPIGPSLVRAVVIPLLLAPWMVWSTASSTLRLHEMRLELERLARTDPLSGALNRRGLAEFADRAFAGLEGTGQLSAIVMDVDAFKSINDTYGHSAGDTVIARVAEITRHVVHSDNYAVGRLGGDELVALVADLSLEETLILAERLRQTIEHMIFIHEDRRIMVTISIGVASAQPADDNAEAMLRRADRSLYVAKSAGRNRVRAAA